MKKYLILGILSFAASADVIKVPVTNVEPIYQDQIIYDTPTRTCELREITREDMSTNLFGGVVGALAGHVITRKLTGSTVNRVLGTAAGAMIGSKIANSGKSRKNMINDCTIKNNYHTEKVVSGYNVSYYINGNLNKSYFHYKPGETISIQMDTTYTVLR